MPSRLLLVALCVLLAGCPAKLPVLTEPSCQGVDCSGQGTCALIPGAGATCLCNAGFRAEGASCVAVQPGQECAGVTCSGHGQCLVLQGPPATPLCRCESGYREVGATSCVPLANPCEGVTCGGNGTCAVRGAEAVCVCNAGFSLMGTTLCVPSAGGPCENVTCSGEGQCGVVNGAARCLCNPGFVANGTACEPAPASPCSGVTCSGHGSCAVTTTNQARCFCDTGFVSGGATSCVMSPANPCMGVTCGGQGTCALANNLPLCVCTPGFQPSGNLMCSRIDDPCARIDCAGHGTCSVSNELPVCTCEAGYRLQPGASTRCVPAQRTLSFVSPARTVVEDEGAFVIPIELSEPPAMNTTLTVSRAGTATSGSDFTALPATFTLVANASFQAVTVTITNDTAMEPDETLVLTLTAPSGWALGPNPTFTLTVLDDESRNLGPHTCVPVGGSGDDSFSALRIDQTQRRVFVAGKTDSSLFGTQGFNPGNAMHATSGGGFGDPIVAAYDFDGGLRWGAQWGTFHREAVGAIEYDPVQQALFTVSDFSNDRLELRKFDAVDGGLAWVQTWADAGAVPLSPFFTGLARPSSLELDPSGRAVIASTTTIPYDGQPLRGVADLFVSSVAPDGRSRWTRIVGSTAAETFGGLALDATGNIYLCGTTSGSVDNQPAGGGFCGSFDSCGNPGTPSPCTDAFLVKFSPTGQKLWTRQWGADRAEGCTGLRINGQGTVLALGYDDGPNVTSLTRFDLNGNRLGSRRDWLYTGAFFLDAQDHISFGTAAQLTKLDPTGTTVVETRHLLQPSQFTGINTFVYAPGQLVIGGASQNYCRVSSPAPGNNAFWAIFTR